MTKTIAIAAALMAATTLAEQYRLKFTATVDIIEDGVVTGTKKIKAGTLIELAAKPDANAAEAPAAEGAKPAAGRAGRLTPSDVSPAMFKANGKPKTTLRAYIELGSSYYGRFEAKKSAYWNVTIRARNADWSDGELITGYISKSSAVAKKLIAAIQDGKSHRCLIKVTPTKDEIFDDLVIIDDFELVAEEGE